VIQLVSQVAPLSKQNDCSHVAASERLDRNRRGTRSLEYERELRLVTYLEPDTLLFPLVGAAFVVLGAAGTVRPRSWTVVTALLLTIPAYVQ
jgi:hypothetical protein